MATIRRVTPRTKIEPISAGSTVGKMRHFRKIVKEEQLAFEAVIGVGRFTLPIPSTRRI